jgi:hypothetical protein
VAGGERCKPELRDAFAGIKPFDTEFRVIHPHDAVQHIKAMSNSVLTPAMTIRPLRPGSRYLGALEIELENT